MERLTGRTLRRAIEFARRTRKNVNRNFNGYKVVAGINHFLPLDYTETSVSDEVMKQGLPTFKEYPFE